MGSQATGRGLSGLPPKHGPPETSRQAASPCPGSPSPCALPLLPAPGHQSLQERWGQPRPGQVFWEVRPLKFLVLNQSKSNAASSSLLQLQVGFFLLLLLQERNSIPYLPYSTASFPTTQAQNSRAQRKQLLGPSPGGRWRTKALLCTQSASRAYGPTWPQRP